MLSAVRSPGANLHPVVLNPPRVDLGVRLPCARQRRSSWRPGLWEARVFAFDKRVERGLVDLGAGSQAIHRSKPATGLAWHPPPSRLPRPT